MAKTRPEIPRATREKVLKEFNHRCAICGTERPQVHHIDENPSNNDLLNLIPLCPNCHLIDQHNPTSPLEPGKLKLFRTYKDPTILKPQFHPLFLRMKFLDEIGDENSVSVLANQVEELCQFIEMLDMGAFYAERIFATTRYPSVGIYFGGPETQKEILDRLKRDADYREQLRNSKKTVYSLIMEIIRFQRWE